MPDRRTPPPPEPLREPRPGAPSEARVDTSVSKERVAGLFDGIVAITATLLIIDFGVATDGEALRLSDLAAALRDVLHWIVSFVMVAVIWREFHLVFAHITRWDGALLVLTFAQMGAISLIPFAAGLVGDNPHSVLAALVFAAIMGLNGLLVSANLAMLRGKAHLHAAPASRLHLHRRMRGQLFVFPVGIAVSVTAAVLHDPLLGILAWALCPIVIALLGRHADASPGAAPFEEEIA